MRLSNLVRSILLAVFGMVTAVSLVSAHAITLLRSDPPNGSILAQPPSEIRAWFGEEMQTGTSTLQVFSADGQRMDSGDGGIDLSDPDHASMVVSVPTLPEGEYLVRWYGVLLDGDTSESVFNFFVGDKAVADAVGFTPADETVLYYQAEDETESGPWLTIGGGLLVLVALLVPITIILRRRK